MWWAMSTTRGCYSKIGNDFGVKNNSTRMLNRIGAAAGKYFGRHVLEGDLSYENRMYHRYGMYLAPDFSPMPYPVRWPITAMRTSRCASATISRI